MLRLRLFGAWPDTFEASVTSTPIRFSTGEARSSRSSRVEVIEGNVACLWPATDGRTEDPTPASMSVHCGPRGNVLDLGDLGGMRGEAGGVCRKLVEEACVRREDAEKDDLSGDRGGEDDGPCLRVV